MSARVRVTVLGTAILLLFVGIYGSSSNGATAAKVPTFYLHKGSSGQKVKDLQWLLAGHKTIWTFKPYFHNKPNGYYGERTRQAVYHTKWRLGYPKRSLNYGAGPQFFRVLRGTEKVPRLWRYRAAKRIQAYTLQHTPCADKLIRVASSQVGVQEYPWGSNSGRQVSVYQSVTGAYHAAWCASFVQWALLGAGYGTVADRSAGVAYIKGWAFRHGYIRGVAAPGALVAFYYDAHHIGIITQVGAQGVWTVEGNSSNGVRRRYHAYGSTYMTYIWLPGCHN